MGDVLEIEVDGAPTDTRARPPSRGPSWGVPAAVGVVGLLMLGLFVTLVIPTFLGGSSAKPSASEGVSPPTGVVEHSDPVVATAASALAAWGEFAVDGDLSHLDGLFHPDGPQYRQLAAEAERLAADAAGGPPYEVTLERATVQEATGTLTSVSATVLWSRIGEATRTYEWRIAMRHAGGAWLLWTVDE